MTFDRLNHSEITMLLLALGVLLTAARVLGEVARKVGQPAILGEILAGIILGPTVLGKVWPEFHASIFPQQGPGAIVLHGMTTLSITLFLLVAGLEVDLSTVWRNGRSALAVSLGGIILPFTTGVALAYFLVDGLGGQSTAHPMIQRLFLGTALSISALPVIAKTLIDLDLYRTDIGMVVMPAAVFEDLVGWLSFAVVLGMMGGTRHFSVAETIGLTLAFAGGMLTLGRWVIHRILPWIQAHLAWPGGVIGFAMALALLCAAFTEAIGIHAVFGAFFVGIALGDSPHLREETRFTLDSFISFFFAPLFFASIGLKVDFIANFDLGLVSVILGVAIVGKVIGCSLGGRMSGMGKRESFAVGFAMNARGAMEIILGLLALQYGVIGEKVFVALVVMALVTSLMSGPLIQWALQREKVRRFTEYLKPSAFVRTLEARTPPDAIRELVQVLARANPEIANVGIDAVSDAVIARERLMHTGIGHDLAIPHVRLTEIKAPVVAVGISESGIDFDSRDGRPARLVCLVVAPEADSAQQLGLLADIARTFSTETVRERAMAASNYTEFVAVTRTVRSKAHHEGSSGAAA